MACIEIEARALKSNLLKEIRMNSTHQSLFDDLWCDEFSVDDLLDLSDKDFSNSDGGCIDRYSEENNSIISSTGDLTSLPETEIHLPVDEMENLEWLSQIVDDSTLDLELSLSLPPVSLKETTGKLPVIPSFTVLGLSYPVPRKSRSKRSRKTGRVWSGLTESSMDDSSYDSSSTMLSANPVQLFDCFMSFLKPATKKFKKNPVHKNSPESIGCITQRRCTHCHVQKTPQWRTGPSGPKTLCNACGVRFKSGKLFPEYRPACSPTFSGGLHSNSHRKVLEMRKQKETVDVKPGFGSGSGSLSC